MDLKKHLNFKNFLWTVYLAVLVVITPHTQWMFAQLEPKANEWVSWVAAVAFELTIFVVTHLLVKHIERRRPTTFNFEKQRLKASLQWWPAFRYRWLNIYTLLLTIACSISAGANLSHAVEYAQPVKIVTEWGVPSWVVTVAFGGILPLVNLLFAAVIADVDDAESVDPELEKATQALREANKAIREKDRALEAAEQRAIEAEQQLRGVANLVRYLFDKDLQLHDRIRGLHAARPDLSQHRIAQLAGCSPSVVNGVLVELRNANSEQVEA